MKVPRYTTSYVSDQAVQAFRVLVELPAGSVGAPHVTFDASGTSLVIEHPDCRQLRVSLPGDVRGAVLRSRLAGSKVLIDLPVTEAVGSGSEEDATDVNAAYASPDFNVFSGVGPVGAVHASPSHSSSSGSQSAACSTAAQTPAASESPGPFSALTPNAGTPSPVQNQQAADVAARTRVQRLSRPKATILQNMVAQMRSTQQQQEASSTKRTALINDMTAEVEVLFCAWAHPLLCTIHPSCRFCFESCCDCMHDGLRTLCNSFLHTHIARTERDQASCSIRRGPHSGCSTAQRHAASWPARATLSPCGALTVPRSARLPQDTCRHSQCKHTWRLWHSRIRSQLSTCNRRANQREPHAIAIAIAIASTFNTSGSANSIAEHIRARRACNWRCCSSACRKLTCWQSNTCCQWGGPGSHAPRRAWSSSCGKCGCKGHRGDTANITSTALADPCRTGVAGVACRAAAQTATCSRIVGE